MNSRKLLETKEMKNVSNRHTDQATITVSNAEQQLNTHTCRVEAFDSLVVCRKTCVLCCLGDASLHLDFALCGVGVRPTHGLPSERPQRTVGVLAGTHWGDDSSRVMSYQSANPLVVVSSKWSLS